MGCAERTERCDKAAEAAELPVLLPIRFELVINAGSVESLGLTIPQALLLRADEVLQ